MALSSRAGKCSYKTMGKILFFLAAAVVGWLVFKILRNKPDAGKTSSPSANRPEKMVKCDLCGVFMPESDSTQLDDKLTCRTPKQCLHRQAA